jgi:hypothetical protein
MTQNTTAMWCIYYRKIDELTNWKTMKLERSDGVLVSTNKRDEVYRFIKIQDAFAFAKKLIDSGKYMAEVKKVSGLYFPE